MWNETRLVLIGKTGSGKSITGNTILNGARHFQTSLQGSSTTQFCQLHKETVQGRRLAVVDTPGLFDTDQDEKKVLNEITNCIRLSTPGPHAFILVTEIGRFTEEDIYSFEKFVQMFGDALYRYLIVVFTRYDDYKREMEDARISNYDIRDYIPKLPKKVRDFVTNKCGLRIVGFDNTLKGDESVKQVQNLFSEIDKMVAFNVEKFYTNDDFRNAVAQQEREMEEEKRLLQKMLDEEARKIAKKIKAIADDMFKMKVKGLEMAKMRLPSGKQISEIERLKAEESLSNGVNFVQSVITDVAVSMTGEKNRVWKRFKNFFGYY